MQVTVSVYSNVKWVRVLPTAWGFARRINKLIHMLYTELGMVRAQSILATLLITLLV